MTEGLASGDRGALDRKRPRQRVLTMPEQIAESISAAIVAGEYQPGDAVREQHLADQFNVSRGPIREALRILEKAGVVTVVPQRGAHVTKLSAQEVNNLFEIRCALVRLLPGHLPLADAALHERVGAALGDLQSLAERGGGSGDYARAVYRMSQLLYDACDNPQLAEMLRSLARQTARYTQLGLHADARQRASARGWKVFARRLRAGQAHEAGEALVELMDASRNAVLAALKGKA